MARTISDEENELRFEVRGFSCSVTGRLSEVIREVSGFKSNVSSYGIRGAPLLLPT
jgi:hypothetical protein